MVRAALFLAALVATGCEPTSTSALLQISAAPGVHLASLNANVLVDGAATVSGAQLAASDGTVQLPGTMVVWLPDDPAQVDIQLVGITTSGGTLHATVAFRSIPHTQVSQVVTLGSPPPGGGPTGGPSGGDLGPGPTDGGVGSPPPPDLAATDGPPSPPPPPPDLAPVTLARDNFQRPDQPLWGRASDGQLWGFDANSSANFAIVSHAGKITDASKNTDTGLIGPSVANSEALTTTSIDSFTDGSEIGPTLRFQNNANFYKAVINGSILKIVVKANGSSTDLVTVSFAATAGTSYAVRFRAQGTTLSAKAWPAASAEPNGWMVSTTDNTFGSGMCGVRVIFETNATASFSSFTLFPL